MARSYPTLTGEYSMLCIDQALVPILAGVIAGLEHRSAWESESDWEQGYQAAAEWQEQLVTNCMSALIAEIRALRGVRVAAEATPDADRSIDDYYSLRDIALAVTQEGDPGGADPNLFGVLRSAWNFDSIRVAGMSDIVSPTLEAILKALRGDTETSDNVLQALRGNTPSDSTRNVIDQIIAVRGPEPPWWDWGSERPTIADMIQAIQQGQGSDTDDSVWDIVDNILGAAGIAGDVGDLIAKTGGDALLAVLLAVAVGQRLSLANIEVNSITTRNLLGELQKTLTGSTIASSDNLMEVLRGPTPRADYDAANILTVLESMDTYLS